MLKKVLTKTNGLISNFIGKFKKLIHRTLPFIQSISLALFVFVVGTPSAKASISTEYLAFSSHPESKFSANATLRTNITDQTSREALVGNASPYVSSLSGITIDQNGNANYQIPIELPQASTDIPVQLSLNYSSSGGASAYGVGWDLNIDSNPEIRIDSQWLNAVDSFDLDCESETYFVGSTRLLIGENDQSKKLSKCRPHSDYLDDGQYEDGKIKELFHQKIDYERTDHFDRQSGPVRFDLDHIKPTPDGRGTTITAVIRHGNSTNDCTKIEHIEEKRKLGEECLPYWWEVREDQLTKIYGQRAHTQVVNHERQIVKWLLQETRVHERSRELVNKYDDLPQPIKIYLFDYVTCNSLTSKCGRFDKTGDVRSKHYIQKITGTRYSVKSKSSSDSHLTASNFDIKFNWQFLDTWARNDGLSDKQCAAIKGKERPDARFSGNLGEVSNYDPALLGSIEIQNNLQKPSNNHLFKSYHFCYEEYLPTHATKLSKVLLGGAHEYKPKKIAELNPSKLITLNEFKYHDDLQDHNTNSKTPQAVWFEEERAIIDTTSATGDNALEKRRLISAFSTSTDESRGGRFHLGLGFSTFKEPSLSLSGTHSASETNSKSPLFDCSYDGNPDLMFDFSSGRCLINQPHPETGEYGYFTNDGKKTLKQDPATFKSGEKNVKIPPEGKGKGKSQSVTIGLMAPVINASVGVTSGKSITNQYQLEANSDQYSDHRDTSGKVYFGLGDGTFSENSWDTRIPMTTDVNNQEVIDQIKETISSELEEGDHCKDDSTSSRCPKDKTAIWIEAKQIKLKGNYDFDLSIVKFEKHKFKPFDSEYTTDGKIKTALMELSVKPDPANSSKKISEIKIIEKCGIISKDDKDCNDVEITLDKDEDKWIFYTFIAENYGGIFEFDIAGTLKDSLTTSPSLKPYMDWQNYGSSRSLDDKFTATLPISGRAKLEGNLVISGLKNDQFIDDVAIRLHKHSNSEITLFAGDCKFDYGTFVDDDGDGIGEWIFTPRITANGDFTCDNNEDSSLFSLFERDGQVTKISGIGIEVIHKEGEPWPQDFSVNTQELNLIFREFNIQEGGGSQQWLLGKMVASLEDKNNSGFLPDNEDPPPTDIIVDDGKSPEKCIDESPETFEEEQRELLVLKESAWDTIDYSNLSGQCFSKPWLVKTDDLATNQRLVTPLYEGSQQILKVPASTAYSDLIYGDSAQVIEPDVNGYTRFLLPNLEFEKAANVSNTWFDPTLNKQIAFRFDIYESDNSQSIDNPDKNVWTVSKLGPTIEVSCGKPQKLTVDSSVPAGQTWSFHWQFQNQGLNLYKDFLKNCAMTQTVGMKKFEWSVYEESGSDKLSYSLSNNIAMSFGFNNKNDLETNLRNAIKPDNNATQRVAGVVAEYIEPVKFALSGNTNFCTNRPTLLSGKNGWDSQIILTEKEIIDDANIGDIIFPECESPKGSKLADLIAKERSRTDDDAGKPDVGDLQSLSSIAATRKQLSGVVKLNEQSKKESGLKDEDVNCRADTTAIFGLAGPDNDICLTKSSNIYKISLGKLGNPETILIADCELAKAAGIQGSIDEKCELLGGGTPDEGQIVTLIADSLTTVSQSVSLPPQLSKNSGTNVSFTRYGASVSTTTSDSKTRLEQIKRGSFNDFVINRQWFASKRNGELIKRDGQPNSLSKTESQSYGITGDFLPENTPVSPFPTFGRSKSNPNIWYEHFNNDLFIDRLSTNLENEIDENGDPKKVLNLLVELGSREGWQKPFKVENFTKLESINLTTTPGLFPSSRFKTEEQLLGAINTGAYGITINGQLSENETDTKCSFVGQKDIDGFCTKLFRPQKVYTAKLDNSGLSTIIQQKFNQVADDKDKDKIDNLPKGTPFTKIKFRQGTNYEKEFKDLYELVDGEQLRSNSRLLTKGFTKGFSLSYAYGTPLVPPPLHITFGAGVNSSKNENETFSAFLDINGDGFDDYVRCGTWGCAYKKNRFGKTLLLKTVTNQTGKGSVQYVDYARKYKDAESPIASWKAAVLISNNHREQTGNHFSLQFNEYKNHLYERGKKQSIGYGETYTLTIKDRESCIDKVEIKDEVGGELTSSSFDLEHHAKYLLPSRSKIIQACKWTVQKNTYKSKAIKLHGRTEAGLPARALYLSNLITKHSTYLKIEPQPQPEPEPNDDESCFPGVDSKLCFESDITETKYRVSTLSSRENDERGNLPAPAHKDQVQKNGDKDKAKSFEELTAKALLNLHPKESLQISLAATQSKHFEQASPGLEQCRASQYYYDSLGYLIKSIDHGVDCIDDNDLNKSKVADAHADNIITRLSYTGMKGLGRESEADKDFPYAADIERNLGSSNEACAGVDVTGIIDAIAVFENTQKGEELKRLRYDEYKCASNFDSTKNGKTGDQVVMPGEMLSRNIAVEEVSGSDVISLLDDKPETEKTLRFAKYSYLYNTEYLGFLSAVIAPEGYTTYYQYARDYPGYLIRVRDNLEQAIDVRYDWRLGKINQRIGTAGEVLQLHYDDFGRVIGETNPKDFHLLTALNRAEVFSNGASIKSSYCLPGAASEKACDLPTTVTHTLFRGYTYDEIGKKPSGFETQAQALQIDLYSSSDKPWRKLTKRAAPPGSGERKVGVTINHRKYLDTAGRVINEAFPVWYRPSSMPDSAKLNDLRADQVKGDFRLGKSPRQFEDEAEKDWEKQLFSESNWRAYIKETGHHNDKSKTFNFEPGTPRRTRHKYDLLDRNSNTTFPDGSKTSNSYKLVNPTEIQLNGLNQLLGFEADQSYKAALLVIDSVDKKLAHNLTINDSRGLLFSKAKTKTGKLPENTENLGKDIWVTYQHNGLHELLEVNEWYFGKEENKWKNGTTLFEYDIVGRNTRINHPDMGERRFSFTDRNLPEMECAGLLKDGSYESIKQISYESGVRPISVQFFQSNIANDEKNHLDDEVTDEPSPNTCTRNNFNRQLAGMHKPDVTYQYDWGKYASEDLRTIGSDYWKSSYDFSASKLVGESKYQELDKSSRRQLYRKQFVYDENGTIVKMFNDIASPLYELEGQSKNDKLIRATSQFTVTDNQARPLEIYSIDGKVVDDRNLLHSGERTSQNLLPHAFRQSINYGAGSSDDERMRSIRIQAGTTNNPQIIVSEMLYDEHERLVRWQQANDTMTISQHYNPITQYLESTVGSKRVNGKIKPQAWHASYSKNELFERIYEYELTDDADDNKKPKTGNISAISLKQQNGREVINEQTPKKLQLTTRYDAQYDEFSRLKSGIGSHWVQDYNRFNHPGFDKKQPNAGCYFQEYEFDDRNNLTKREHFVLDDIVRKQFPENTKPIKLSIQVPGTRIPKTEYVWRTENVAWKALKERMSGGVYGDDEMKTTGRRSKPAFSGRNNPTDYKLKERSFKEIEENRFGVDQQGLQEFSINSFLQGLIR